MSDFTVINDDEESRAEFGYNCGTETFEISRDDIQALLDGKMLATVINDEYSVFIRMEKEEEPLLITCLTCKNRDNFKYLPPCSSCKDHSNWEDPYE